jgi:hypothetical protein
MLKTVFLGLMFCVASSGFAQENPLAGAIDIHVHTAPDSTPRSIDAIDLARLAKSRGMRGLVLKNHYEPTASLAYIVRKEVPGIEVFGGIDLNLSLGGMNPSAVEHMAAITGGYGRALCGWRHLTRRIRCGIRSRIGRLFRLHEMGSCCRRLKP